MNALLDVIGDIYEASFVPQHWNKVASELCRLFNAHSSGIFMEDYEYEHRDIIGSCGFPRTVTLAYRLGLSKYDYTFQLQAASAPGQAQQLVDAREFKTTHPFYYRLLLKPNDVGFLSTMGIYRNEEWHVGIALHRSFNAEPFSAEELQTLQLLYPHFKRALRIYKEFYKLRSQQQSLQAALGHITLGLIILNPNGSVDYCNPIAETLLTHHQGLKITARNTLQAHVYAENKQLHSLIDQLTLASKQKQVHHNQAIALHHPDQEHVIHIMLTILDDSHNQNPQGKIALYISVPNSSFNLSAETLHKLYGITPAESNVAIALANGLSPSQISESNGVSIETVRSQLKSIYIKMGVKKQQDVIRILLSGILNIK
ncbi:helix-turn-helix transcriptional regulator [Cellvibrio japonicus]|uniref:Transcriptional regulator, LuxR family n=1 Tax=Cellvibrio japonicus (strain Ueda107) TaxID=498211 RepID=B3PF52_CELJU|nr:LuxR C-terminal-related transcriptional regulator [Cellvibrio japonicus]ACE83643.1 transcriptional regulator, LuxR family [Cellvibrio japonicus Ueda107]QEI13608.1 LuxR family transcriptional regulator [Cellvibrio japonicus]QEI17182.1 LuxR family transcriptional regulator [Cellvibrio japonicus]QEI20759.1 LuxR family transcriptional regulator [Cellvibrio japonicus]